MPDVELNSVVEEIRQHWGQVIAPTADRNQWFDALKREFKGYSVWNWSDFNYDKANWYEILLHPGTHEPPGSREKDNLLIEQLGGEYYTLTLMLSVVAPYYLLKLSKVKADHVLETIHDIPSQYQIFLDKTHQFAKDRGFRELPVSYLEHVIPDVELDIVQQGNVTVFNCLFSDTDSPVSLV